MNNLGYKTIRTENGVELRYNVVMEEKLGRPLKSDEMVHHIDQVKRNDASNNLYLCECHGIHRSIHRQFNKLINEFGKELLREDIIKFDRKKGIYHITDNFTSSQLCKIIQEVNPNKDILEDIAIRRKEIIKKAQEPRNNYLYHLGKKKLFDKMNEIDEKIRRKWAFEQDKIMLDIKYDEIQT